MYSCPTFSIGTIWSTAISCCPPDSEKVPFPEPTVTAIGFVGSWFPAISIDSINAPNKAKRLFPELVSAFIANVIFSHSSSLISKGVPGVHPGIPIISPAKALGSVALTTVLSTVAIIET